jgi:hypothetical protein
MKVRLRTVKSVMREAEVPMRSTKMHLQTPQIPFAEGSNRHAEDENPLADV